MRTLLPLYIHPAADPQAWTTAAGIPDLVIVVNIHNGPAPGTADPTYRQAIARLRGVGQTLLGYVDLGHGARAPGEVNRDLVAWRSYPVGGIFFDQTPSGRDQLGRVGLATRAARRIGYHPVVLNPGTPPDPRYAELGAVVTTFEGPWAQYETWGGCDWPDQVCHLVYDVPTAMTGRAGRLMAERGAGMGLVTDAPPDAPYGRLPWWLGP